MVRLIAFSILALLFYCGTIRADVTCQNGYPEVNARIQSGDFKRLVECLDVFIKKGMPQCTKLDGRFWGCPYGWVTFDSEGGDINEAIKIGRFLRQSAAEVSIKTKCYSACFIAVVGAIYIYKDNPFDDDTGIGIHRLYNDQESLKRTDLITYERYYNQSRESVKRYLSELDVPTMVIEKMFSVPSTDLYILSREDMQLLNRHPAFEEWVTARCSEYTDVLPEPRNCEYKARWDALTYAVRRHLEED